MATFNDQGKPNNHMFTGWQKDMGIPTSLSYDIPVPPARHAFISKVIADNFPGKQFKIKGCMWDYEHQASMLNPGDEPRDAFIGHYKVEIDGLGERIMQVEYSNAETALRTSAEFFDVLKDEGIRSVRALKWDDGNYYRDVDTDGGVKVAVHMTPFMGNAKRLIADGTTIEKHLTQLGEIAGKLYNAGVESVLKVLPEMKAHSDISTMRLWEKGLQAFDKTLGTQAHYDYTGITGAQLVAAMDAPEVPHIASYIDDKRANLLSKLARQIMEDERIPTAFNVIEKQIYIDDETGDLILGCYDTAGRGYVSMMTEHTTYDLGTIVQRVVLNRGLYSGTPEEIDGKILRGLEEFVEGYNAKVVTGAKITVEEALESAQNSFAMLMMHGCGLYADNRDNPATTRDMVDHFKTNLKYSADRVAEIPRLMALRSELGNEARPKDHS